MDETEKNIVVIDPEIDEKEKTDLEAYLGGGKRRKYSRFVLAALGSIPWVGGLLAASSALDAEKEQGRINSLHALWLEEHNLKVSELGQVLNIIIDRLESIGEEVQTRIESPAYLALVREGFRDWDQAETQEKQDLIRKLLTNAGATTLCPDDLIRLFLSWIRTYHEAHFMVIREIYRSKGIGRGDIWDKIHGTRPREDSAEADLFKLLISDLSIGRVIRQHRETDYNGNFLKKPSGSSKKESSGTMKSAFDNSDSYELTELGSRFVHYTMEEVVTRVDNNVT
jgi:hypothetical protein